MWIADCIPRRKIWDVDHTGENNDLQLRLGWVMTLAMQL